jgi:hypothetical protein
VLVPQGSGAEVSEADDAGGNPAGQGGLKRCANLKVTLGQGAGDFTTGEFPQVRVPVVFTNRSGAPCVLRGYPGARFDGEDGSTWDLPRTKEAIPSTTLGPQEQAGATLTYLSASNAEGWHVKTLSVTPPNTTDTQQLEWREGPVVKQDGATHPGSFLGPIKPQGQ